MINNFLNEEEHKRHLNYQTRLDMRFGGTLIATTKNRCVYLNDRAVLIHRCLICSYEYYEKPRNVLNKPFTHICYSNSRLSKAKRDEKIASRLKELEEQKLYIH